MRICSSSVSLQQRDVTNAVLLPTVTTASYLGKLLLHCIMNCHYGKRQISAHISHAIVSLTPAFITKMLNRKELCWNITSSKTTLKHLWNNFTMVIWVILHFSALKALDNILKNYWRAPINSSRIPKKFYKSSEKYWDFGKKCFQFGQGFLRSPREVPEKSQRSPWGSPQAFLSLTQFPWELQPKFPFWTPSGTS